MLTLTPLPFTEHYILIREYDCACLLYINGEPQRIIGRASIGGGVTRNGCTRVHLEAVPVLIVEAKEAIP
jgi:hypothetical protein